MPDCITPVLAVFSLNVVVKSSSGTNLLSVPCVRICFGSRSFSVAVPAIWNSLLFDICNSCSISFFRRKLKTFYFSTSSHV